MAVAPSGTKLHQLITPAYHSPCIIYYSRLSLEATKMWDMQQKVWCEVEGRVLLQAMCNVQRLQPSSLCLSYSLQVQSE